MDHTIFLRIYAQVATRCFNIGDDQYAMVPMADNYNHSHFSIEYMVISKPDILEPKKTTTLSDKNVIMNDYSFIFRKELTELFEDKDQQSAARKEFNIRGRFNRDMFEQTWQSLSLECIKNQIAQHK